MKSIFADTSYFIGLLYERDRYHERAINLADEIQSRITTTAFVISELASYMAQPRDRHRFLTFMTNQADAEDFVVVPCTPQWYEGGLDLFAERPDKAWSLVDCISFLVMENFGITEALTADHHFQQAGFIALML